MATSFREEIDAEGVEHHVSERTLARFAELTGPDAPAGDL